MVSHGLDTEQAKKIWQPFLDWVARSLRICALAGPIDIGSMPARHWWDVEWRAKHRHRVFVSDNRLGVRRSNVWCDRRRRQSGLVHLGLRVAVVTGIAARGRFAGAPRHCIVCRLAPWRYRATFQSTARSRRIQGSQDMNRIQGAADQIRRCMDKLRAIAPNRGSYVSESNFFEEAWQRSYWGSNYPRLASIKKKYDPTGPCFVHHGVGSEEWSADGFTKL
jgi:hypothetical protein